MIGDQLEPVYAPPSRFAGVVAAVSVVVVVCLAAFPLGLAAHAALWMLAAGWNVIG